MLGMLARGAGLLKPGAMRRTPRRLCSDTISLRRGFLSSLLPPRRFCSHRRDAERTLTMEGTTGADGGLPAGQLNAAIANELGKLIAEFTGRGSEKSRAFIDGDVVVCLLENGATKGERKLVAAGRADVVRLGRDVLQHAMKDQLVAAVERLTGRKVRTFLSGTSALGESSVEVFVLEPEHSTPNPGATG